MDAAAHNTTWAAHSTHGLKAIAICYSHNCGCADMTSFQLLLSRPEAGR